MKKEVFIYAEEKSSKGYIHKGILPIRVTYTIRQKISDKEILEYAQKNYTYDKMLKIFNQCKKDLQNKIPSYNPEVIKLEMVMPTKGKWFSGEYYAHEYDQYAEGRARKITYSNGYYEYEIECLDKSLNVLDGVWEDPYSNGCGDTFELWERTNWGVVI